MFKFVFLHFDKYHLNNFNYFYYLKKTQTYGMDF